MKKIIITLAMLVFLASCWNDTKEITETPIVETEVNNIDETINTDDIKDNSDYEDKIPSEEIEENTETPIEWIPDTEVNTDDEALEAEVNDLLDEFIDSLDSYDK